ncbi:D-alanyl-D-alanine carboxypeptidase family protein [Lichenicoccus sp.]|uniref:D-alanyl-D-alanine carboxypeptidase family protein n=1 Tax=Lichenicoccus sp. TaxID=2781899 RepID=UPI003D124A18
MDSRGRLLSLIGLLAPCALMALGLLIVACPRARAQYVGRVSSFVVDANNGRVLQDYNPDLRRYPASLTKLMTLYLAFRALHQGRIALDQAVPVSAHAASMEPSKLGLVPGTYMTVQQAILALVTKSANDAACALGELIGGGSEPHFADLMTRQARLLGMTDTVFRNASGLPDPAQVSTARDFAMLTRHLIHDFPDDYRYFSVPAFMFHGRYIGNHDAMLRLYPGADGLKTGYTAEAGHNLITSAVRGNVRLIGVVLGARTNPQRSAMMENLLDAGFAAEGVAPLARPAPRHERTPLTLVSNHRRGRPLWHGRHHLRHFAHSHYARLHLTGVQYRRHHGHALHFVGARLRRVLAHVHHVSPLRLSRVESPTQSNG